MAQEKHFYTISEVSEICQVKAHVLRYWEKEFDSLKPSTRRGRRRYYQAHDIEHIHTIRRLLYDEGFTINGARAQIIDDKLAPKLQKQKAVRKQSDTLQLVIGQLESILALMK